MQTITYDLNALLKGIKSKLYTIPQFQRDFVWTESQIKLLIDSISRNYPIGSLLTLPKSPELSLQSKPIHVLVSEEDTNSEIETEELQQEVQYVLDGQQRLTAIARAFLNANPKKSYYFDLKTMLEVFEKGKENVNWIRTRLKSKDSSESERKDKGRLLRTDVVLQQQKTDIFVSEYMEDSGDIPELIADKKLARKSAAIIKGIFETIRKYQIPIVVLDRDAPLESVCRVFETINSTGTRLTTFDLAVAKFFPNPDLRDLWDRCRARYEIFNDFDVDGERLLQILSLWEAKVSGRFPEATRRTLLTLKKDFITKNWETAAEFLAEAYEWAKSNGATPNNLSNHGILVSIACFKLVCNKIIQKTLTNIEPTLKRWYFSKIMRTSRTIFTNYVIGQDFISLIKYGEEQIPPDCWNVNLTIDKLIEINKPQDSRYKAIQCIMIANTPKDLMTGQTLNTKEIEDHHIFPKSLQKQGIPKNTLDSIANRIIVSKNTNRLLSDQKPEHYFSALKEDAKKFGTNPELNRRLLDCLIPNPTDNIEFTQQFHLSNFNTFLKKRAELTLAKIKEVLGDSLTTNEEQNESEEDMDDDV